jgi:hypothetical protein
MVMTVTSVMTVRISRRAGPCHAQQGHHQGELGGLGQQEPRGDGGGPTARALAR